MKKTQRKKTIARQNNILLLLFVWLSRHFLVIEHLVFQEGKYLIRVKVCAASTFSSSLTPLRGCCRYVFVCLSVCLVF